MTLRETIDEIMVRKGWLQKDVAAYLGLDPSTLSTIGKQWESHWQSFLKLLPLCIELDLIAERDLLPRRHESTASKSLIRRSRLRLMRGGRYGEAKQNLRVLEHLPTETLPASTRDRLAAPSTARGFLQPTARAVLLSDRTSKDFQGESIGNQELRELIPKDTAHDTRKVFKVFQGKHRLDSNRGRARPGPGKAQL